MSTVSVDMCCFSPYTGPMITPAQSRAARALLEWSQPKLAEEAGIGFSTLRDFEKGRHTPRTETFTALIEALETAGVEFIAENGGGAGVRLRKD